MEPATENTLFRACRILFGPETAVSRSFLYCLQPSGVSKAFKKKALETHPDRVILLDEKTKKRCVELFIEADWAREQLMNFCVNRGGDILPLKYKRTAANQDPAETNYRRTRRKTRVHLAALPGRRLRFGEFLYYSGSITWGAFIKAIVWQRRQRPRFGDIARRWRYLSDQQMEEVLMGKKFFEPIGRTAVRMKSLSQFQVNTILFHQIFVQKPLGEFFVEHGYLTGEKINQLLGDFKRHNEKFIVRT